ncbi:MAG: PaaI family thioesterase [Neomegalonema sp.]|nr:PaaI family thioesterase [Neomegalonema sp.]
MISQQELSQISGLDFIRGMQSGQFPPPAIARTLNFALHKVETGRVVFRGQPGAESLNPFAAVHGGWFGAILDSCMACAVQTTLPKGSGYTTLEYKINIVRALDLASEPVLAIGDALHVGRRTGTAEGKLLGEQSGKTYAFATTTCLIMALD